MDINQLIAENARMRAYIEDVNAAFCSTLECHDIPQFYTRGMRVQPEGWRNSITVIHTQASGERQEARIQRAIAAAEPVEVVIALERWDTWKPQEWKFLAVFSSFDRAMQLLALEYSRPLVWEAGLPARFGANNGFITRYENLPDGKTGCNLVIFDNLIDYGPKTSYRGPIT